MRFEDLQLIPQLVRAVHDEGYTTPTPIQEKSIPHVLAGKDLLGCAQTGTGKTAAFALPILQRLQALPIPHPRHIRVLVLAPTRELATQIGDSFRVYGRHLGFKQHVIYGGVGQHPQTEAMRRGLDIVVATPGRLLDLMGQGHAKLGKVEVLVLDEADRMLDMGFIHDVRKIINGVPKKRQTLFFSATLPHDIKTLAHDILTDPVRVEVTPTATTVEKIAQTVAFVGKADKFPLLSKLMKDPAIQRALVFTRTKHGANKLAQHLNTAGVRSDAIHGNKAQSARERALDQFRRGKLRVLVATDIAARGIDVDGITHVFNYDLPNVPDSYVHRIGRTARAGASGAAVSFCSPEERGELADIERLIRIRIPVMEGTPDLRGPEGARGGAPKRGHGAQGWEGQRQGGGQRGRQQDNRPRGGHSGGRGEYPARSESGRSPAHRPAAGTGNFPRENAYVRPEATREGKGWGEGSRGHRAEPTHGGSHSHGGAHGHSHGGGSHSHEHKAPSVPHGHVASPGRGGSHSHGGGHAPKPQGFGAKRKGHSPRR